MMAHTLKAELDKIPERVARGWQWLKDRGLLTTVLDNIAEDPLFDMGDECHCVLAHTGNGVDYFEALDVLLPERGAIGSGHDWGVDHGFNAPLLPFVLGYWGALNDEWARRMAEVGVVPPQGGRS